MFGLCSVITILLYQTNTERCQSFLHQVDEKAIQKEQFMFFYREKL